MWVVEGNYLNNCFQNDQKKVLPEEMRKK
jgi:hypothetical protein